MSAKQAIGVDLGGTKILAGVVTRDGEVVRRHERATPQDAQESVVRELEAAVAELSKVHRVSDQFEAQLALGEIEMKSGKPASGRPRLAALEKEATTKGFLLIARKAHIAANNR